MMLDTTSVVADGCEGTDHSFFCHKTPKHIVDSGGHLDVIGLSVDIFERRPHGTSKWSERSVGEAQRDSSESSKLFG